MIVAFVCGYAYARGQLGCATPPIDADYLDLPDAGVEVPHAG